MSTGPSQSNSVGLQVEGMYLSSCRQLPPGAHAWNNQTALKSVPSPSANPKFPAAESHSNCNLASFTDGLQSPSPIPLLRLLIGNNIKFRTEKRVTLLLIPGTFSLLLIAAYHGRRTLPITLPMPLAPSLLTLSANLGILPLSDRPHLTQVAREIPTCFDLGRLVQRSHRQLVVFILQGMFEVTSRTLPTKPKISPSSKDAFNSQVSRVVPSPS